METVECDGLSADFVLKEALADPPYSVLILHIVPFLGHRSGII